VLMRGRRDREARDVRERLELLLVDRDFRVQAAAIEALAVIGDPAAIPALRRTVERELDGRLRRRSKEVIRDLEESAPPLSAEGPGRTAMSHAPARPRLRERFDSRSEIVIALGSRCQLFRASCALRPGPNESGSGAR